MAGFLFGLLAAVAAATLPLSQGDKSKPLKIAQPEFSFVYGGRSSQSLLPTWKPATSSRRLDAGRKQVVRTWRDPASHLLLTSREVWYADFPCVEWTLTFKNEGKADTPILQDIQALDQPFVRTGAGEFLLHHNVGSPASKSDYGPLETPLGPNAFKRIGAAGGRPTNTDMSYFNLAYDGGGALIVVGWPGQWTSTFARDAGSTLRVRAGQELTHFKLHPGEEVRSPLMVVQRYKGDWIDGQNQWRRWMMAYGMPKPGGKLPQPMLEASSSRAYGEMIGANEANQIMHIDRYKEERIPLDYWWMDAGWYIQEQGWPQVGTWEPDPKRFPRGFKPISDHARKNGMKTLVWFEPERVAPGTWLATHHPEWLISPLGALRAQRASKLGTGEPCAVFNQSDTQTRTLGIVWEPREFSLHPGPKGEYAVARYTADASRRVFVDARFFGCDGRTTTDGHVLLNGRPLWNGKVDRPAGKDEALCRLQVDLNPGDTLDFVVGYGNGAFHYDTTGLTVRLSEREGAAPFAALGRMPSHSVAGTGWTFGWLPPAPAPDASAFSKFDKEVEGGNSGNRLLYLGNPQALKWLIEHVDGLITKNGIGLYRQDFNFDPLEFWRSNDAPDRQGITEIKHVTGYLAYWDELRRRHPNMLIDSCASGGRRNDLETMRRSVPLWRSDYAFEPIGHQCMTYGISMWLPYHGTGTVAQVDAPYYGGGPTGVDPYAFWSNTAPSLGLGIDIRERGLDYETLRKLIGDWRATEPYCYGDYYPLTPYSQAEDVWIAWSFVMPKGKSALVMAFRRQKEPTGKVRLVLRGLDPKTSYTVRARTNGVKTTTRASGMSLMREGLDIEVTKVPGVAVLELTSG
ncbi:MAG: alpha-galactosidase [Armatimonadetes bacterium]|nr:alpha-galactosidase [Armatimonadota bacterium]